MNSQFKMIKNITTNKVLARTYTTYKSLFSQALGLMFKKNPKSVLFIFYIEKNWGITTLFMNFPIDIIFLDSNKKVTKVAKRVKPGKFNIEGYCKYVIELPTGKALNTSNGDKISFK